MLRRARLKLWRVSVGICYHEGMTTTNETPADTRFVIFAVWAIMLDKSLTRMWRIAVFDAATGREWDVAWNAIRGSAADHFGEAIREGLAAVDASLDRGEPIGTVPSPVLFSVYNDSVDDFFAGIEGRYDVTMRTKYLDWMEREPEARVIRPPVPATT